MREILFRGQCCTDGKWVEGYLGIEVPDELVIQQFSFDEYFKSNCIDQYSVKPETVGQYTGLTDKNGIKVFEGDIISGKSGRFKVIWCDIICSFIAAEMDEIHGLPSMNKGTLKYYEIIGNIYDNPELLTR